MVTCFPGSVSPSGPRLLASRSLWEEALCPGCLTDTENPSMLFQISSGTLPILFLNITFPFANLCEALLLKPTSARKSLSCSTLIPGRAALHISLALSYGHGCPRWPCWSRSSWQMSPGYCGKRQTLANAQRSPFSIFFLQQSHLKYLQNSIP